MTTFAHKHAFVIFFILIAGMSVTFLDQTILPVSLPVIQKELSIDSELIYWIVNSYFLSAAVLFIAGGKFADGMGHRKGFLLGTALFGITSLFCGLSGSGIILCFARFLQGASVALVVPSATSLVLEIFPSHQKGKIMGLMIGVSSLFLLLGPFLGGVLTQYLSWRYIFFVNIPLCLYAVIAGWILLPKSQLHPQKFDIPGFMLLILSMLSLVYPIMQVHVWGWSSVKFWVLILAASVFIGLLYVLSKRDEHPFIDLSLFKVNKFTGAVLITFYTQFALALSVFWPIYFQKILNFSPAVTGGIILLSILPVMLFAPIGGKLSDKYGSYVPAKYGFIALAFCLIWSVFALPTLNVYAIVFGMFFLGIGVTLISSSTGIFGLGAVDSRKKGIASGIYSTARYMGISFGVAVVGTVIDTFQAMMFRVNLQYHSDTTKLNANELLSLYSNNQETLNYVHTLEPHVQEHIYTSLNTATSYAYSIGTLLILGVVILGFAALHKFFKNHENPSLELKESGE